MELRHLRYFVVLAEELHFGRAALRLHIVQPALSTQIQSLEMELGVQLLNRTKRSVRLTRAGEVFLEGARRTLEQGERAVRDARRAGDGSEVLLAVGFVGSATYNVLTEILSIYRERFPGVTLSPREMNTVSQIEALRNGCIEAGFLRRAAAHEYGDLEAKVILREPLVAALPKSHPLTARQRVPLEALADETFVVPSREKEPGYHEQLVGACERAGFYPKAGHEVTELQVGLGLIAAGVGVTLVPSSVRNLKTTGVAYRRLRGHAPKMELSVVRRREEPSCVLRDLLDVSEEFVHRSVARN